MRSAFRIGVKTGLVVGIAIALFKILTTTKHSDPVHDPNDLSTGHWPSVPPPPVRSPAEPAGMSKESSLPKVPSAMPPNTPSTRDAAPRKAAAKKALKAVKKAAVKKAAVKKAAGEAAAKKAAGEKSAVKKAAAQKSPVKKSPVKKAAAKKAAVKKTGKKPATSKDVG